VADPIDVAYVEIRPDVRGFAAETERGITRALAGTEPAVDIQPGVRGLAAETKRSVRRALAGVHAELGVDLEPKVRGFARETERAVTAATTGVEGDVDIEPNVRGFSQETERAVARSVAGVNANIDIEPNTRGFAGETERAVERAVAATSAEIRVEPVLPGFAIQTKTAVDRALLGVEGNVDLEPSVRGFATETNVAVTRALIGVDGEVDIEPDMTGFRATVKRSIDRALAGIRGEVPVSPVRGTVGEAAAAAAVTSRGGGAAAVGIGAAAGATNLKAATSEVTALGRASELSQKHVGSLTSSLALLGGSGGRLAALGTAGAIAGIGAGAAIAARSTLNASTQFETAFAGVRKTVTASDAELETLRKSFIDLSTQIPVTASDLAGIGQAAGALGIHTNAIIGFTDTVAKLGVTTDLTADVAGDALARIANITNLPQEQFSNLGSTLVQLGNTTASTESEIVDFALRIAGAGKQIGLSIGDITGFGAALASVGINAESGGTAISTTFIKIASAVDAGGKRLQAFADTAGVSSSEFAEQFRTKPAAAVLAFIEGLGRVKTEGGSVFATLDKLGLGGIRVRDALLRASGAGKLFSDAIKTGNTAFQQNEALNRVAAARFDTTASRIQLAKNEVNALQISIGDGLNRAVGEAATGLGTLIRDLRGSEDAANLVTQVIDSLKAAFGPLALAFRGVGPEIKDAFGDAARIFSTLLFAAKPLLLVFGVQLAGSIRIGVKAMTLLLDIFDKVAQVARASMNIIIRAIDKFLGAFSELAHVANAALPGNPFGGVEDKINTAREHLRSFSDELDAIGGKTVRATVTVDLQLPSTAFIESQIGGVAADAARAAKGAVTTTTPTTPTTRTTRRDPRQTGTTPRTGRPPAFGEPGFKTGTAADPTKGFFDPKAEVPKLIQARNQRLEDEVQLAKTRNEITSDDKAALKNLADFATRQSNNIDLSVQIRRQFLIEAQGARQEIRQIQTQEAADAKTATDAEKAAGEKRRKDAQDRKDTAISNRESLLQANLNIAQTTQQDLSDDKRALRALITFYAGRVAILGKRTAAGRDALAKEKAAAAEIKKIDTQIADQRRTARLAKAATRLDSLDDDVSLAKLTRGSTTDDVRALTAERSELTRQINALGRNDPLRKKLKIKWQQVTNDLEDIAKAKGEATDAAGLTDKAKFAQAAFKFLQDQQGFTANLIGNLIPGGLTGGLVGASEASRTGSAAPRPDRPSDVGAGVSGPQQMPTIDLAMAQAMGDSRNGLTQGQANQLLSLTRQMLDALHAIKRGGKFPEAGVATARTRHAQEGVF
jgi:TP901 family phage tail tape measure protein